MNSVKLQDLIQAHLDERLGDEEFAALESYLETHPEARAEYVELAHLDAGLRDDGVTSGGAKVVAFPVSGVHARWLAAAAALIAVLLPLYLFMRNEEGPSGGEIAMAATRGVAVITAEGDAVWAKDGRALGSGVTLEPGRLVLEKGLAQIDFFGGASVSLSGPAEIELIDRDAAILFRGKLRAGVPPAARGFKLTAGKVLLEDLGTSFGLSVGDDNDRADLVVFDGEVRAVSSNGKSLSLLGGDVALLEKGGVQRQEATAVTFPDIEDVLAGSGTEEQGRYAAWKEASFARRGDSRLVAYYDFEYLTDATRRVVNRASEGLGSELDGGIVGARVTEGRWGQKTGLDFRSEGDRVRFDIPGEYEAITLYAWVRIDALDRQLNSLFLTDFFDENEIHWQISNAGHMHFAVSPMGAVDIPEHNRRFYSENFWDPSMSGQWFLLAVTAGKGVGTVRFYVNGEPIDIADGTQMHQPIPAMRFGQADLGNWSEPIREQAIRTLNGRIDEFALYSVALSAEEIMTIYEEGKP